MNNKTQFLYKGEYDCETMTLSTVEIKIVIKNNVCFYESTPLYHSFSRPTVHGITYTEYICNVDDIAKWLYNFCHIKNSLKYTVLKDYLNFSFLVPELLN